MLDHLSTGVRMKKWGIEERRCVFCGERDESRDHLYFACPYTYTVWLRCVGGIIGDRATLDWSDTLVLLHDATLPAMDYILLRLVFQVTVYFVWRERNARMHKTSWLDTGQLCRHIDRTICNRILALGYHGSYKYEGLLRKWFAVYG